MLMKKSEVAEMLKCSEKTVSNLIMKGELTGYKLGGIVRVDVDSVYNFIENSKMRGEKDYE